MIKYESGEIPWVQIGNRKGLTHHQLVAHPELGAFYKRFEHCFEPAGWNIDAVLFIEPEKPEGDTHG